MREAFDNADVDGNGYIEFEELETVLLSLAPSGARTLQDVQYLWARPTQLPQYMNPSTPYLALFFIAVPLHSLCQVEKCEI